MLLGSHNKNDRSYGPSTVYIHEKNVPYPYYMPDSHHHCDFIGQDSHRHMMQPYYFFPLVILGTVILFAVLTVGLLIFIDRARLTPVIRARMQSPPSQLSLTSTEEVLIKALDVYNRLNNS